MDTTPGHGDRVHARGLRGPNVEGRVADIRRVLGRHAQPVDGGENRVGRRLLPLRVVGGDHDLEVRLELGQAREREADGGAALGGDDAEPAAFGPQPRQHLDHLPERLQLVVQRLVVLAVGGNEVVDAVGRERLHLRDEARAADGRAQHLFGNVAAQHRLRRVLHGCHDHRPGVDQRAVEIEENDRKPHAFHRSDARSVLTLTR